MTTQQRFGGFVKWFDAARGFGFLKRQDGADVFVHFSAINANGYRNLNGGDEVEFECEDTPKGLRAVNVTVESQ